LLRLFLGLLAKKSLRYVSEGETLSDDILHLLTNLPGK